MSKATRNRRAQRQAKQSRKWAPTNDQAPAGTDRQGLQRMFGKLIVRPSRKGPAHLWEPSPGVLGHPEA